MKKAVILGVLLLVAYSMPLAHAQQDLEDRLAALETLVAQLLERLSALEPEPVIRGFGQINSTSTSITLELHVSHERYATDYIIEYAAWSPDAEEPQYRPFLGDVSKETETTVTGLDPNAYYHFRVAPVGQSGQGSWAEGYGETLFDAPVLTADAVTDTSVQIEWTEYDTPDNYVQLTYKPSLSSDIEDCWTYADDIEDSNIRPGPYVLEGLKPATSYDFKIHISSHYNYGIGEVTATTSGQPDPNNAQQICLAPPNGLRASTANTSAVSLAWEPVAGAIDYVIEHAVENYDGYGYGVPGEYVAVNDDVSINTNATVTGLDPLRKYWFRVAGVTQEAQTLWAYDTASAGGAVLLLTAGTPTQDAVPLEWTVPNYSPTSSHTVSYDIRYKKSIDSNVESCWEKFSHEVITNPSTTAIVPNLKPSTTYDFRITTDAGYGNGDDGPYFSTATATTFGQQDPNHTQKPCTGLAQPDGLRASTMSSSEVSLAWEPLEDAVDYMIEHVREEYNEGYHEGYPFYGKYAVFDDDISTNTNATVTGLDPLRKYWFRVAGVTQEAQTLWAYDTATTDGAVLILTAGNSTQTTVPLNWTSTNYHNSPFYPFIVDYYIQYKKSIDSDVEYCWNSTWPATAPATSYTVSHLKPATTYDFKITTNVGYGNGTDGPYSSMTEATTLGPPDPNYTPEKCTGPPPPPPPDMINVTGTVYDDSNDNGRLDAGELGVSGQTVIITNTEDVSDVYRTVTGADGSYSITIEEKSSSSDIYLIQVEGTQSYLYRQIWDDATINLGV